jgi:rhodanese-related sulfurtransferase
MTKHTPAIIVLALILLTCLGAKADDPNLMTREQLLPMIGNPQVIIIDVRTKYEWDGSASKIKGAVREEGMRFASWINKYPKEKVIVLYCA